MLVVVMKITVKKYDGGNTLGALFWGKQKIISLVIVHGVTHITTDHT